MIRTAIMAVLIIFSASVFVYGMDSVTAYYIDPDEKGWHQADSGMFMVSLSMISMIAILACFAFMNGRKRRPCSNAV